MKAFLFLMVFVFSFNSNATGKYTLNLENLEVIEVNLDEVQQASKDEVRIPEYERWPSFAKDNVFVGYTQTDSDEEVEAYNLIFQFPTEDEYWGKGSVKPVPSIQLRLENLDNLVDSEVWKATFYGLLALQTDKSKLLGVKAYVGAGGGLRYSDDNQGYFDYFDISALVGVGARIWRFETFAEKVFSIQDENYKQIGLLVRVSKK